MKFGKQSTGLESLSNEARESLNLLLRDAMDPGFASLSSKVENILNQKLPDLECSVEVLQNQTEVVREIIQFEVKKLESLLDIKISEIRSSLDQSMMSQTVHSEKVEQDLMSIKKSGQEQSAMLGARINDLAERFATESVALTQGLEDLRLKHEFTSDIHHKEGRGAKALVLSGLVVAFVNLFLLVWILMSPT